MIAGVCGGLGEYLGVDPVWLRLFFVLLLFATGFGFWAYLILWIIVPEEGRESATPGDTVQANVQDMADRARELGQSIQRGLRGDRASADAGPTSGPVIVGLAFILLGAFLLLNQLNVFWWLRWDVMWPMLIILLGGALLFSRLKE
jgi:phage shock protein PspC (stress-responsive transcriptional regulator)